MAIAEREIASESREDGEAKKCLHRQVDFLVNSQLPNNLWTASVETDLVKAETDPIKKPRAEYLEYIWLRDCVHITRALLFAGEKEVARKALGGFLTIVKNQEEKLDAVITNPTLAREENGGHNNRFMPRFRKENLSPVTRENNHDDWGNFQNDVPGAILWLFGKSEDLGFGFLQEKENQRFLGKVVSYLEAIRFWEDRDDGFWEEHPLEVRSSSLTAVTAGLLAITPHLPTSSDLTARLINRGREGLSRLLPRETEARENDGALLYTIDPYGMVNKQMAKEILERTERHLLKENGCIRYPGDQYNFSWQGNHAEWPKLLFKLAIGYELVGDEEKARTFLNKGLSQQQEDGLFPEALCDGREHPVNHPLLWASAEAINAMVIVNGKHREESCFSALVPQLR